MKNEYSPAQLHLSVTFSILFCLLMATTGYSLDKFWVSFSSVNGSLQLMQIDQNGNVTKTAFVVGQDALGGDSNLTAMAYDSNGNIVYWFTRFVPKELYRVVIDSATLTPSNQHLILTGFNSHDSLEATSLPGFLALSIKQGVPKGIGVDNKGLPTGSTFRISPGTGTNVLNRAFTVSQDGRMGAATAHVSDIPIYLQPLAQNGHPSGSPSVYLTHSSIIGSLDLTNVLPSGRRFLVFVDFEHHLHKLQIVDGQTGAKIGSWIQVTNLAPADDVQSVMVDPEGRFVLFVQPDPVCSSVEDALFIQLLDPDTGHAVGQSKKVASTCDFSNPTGGQFLGMNLLKVQ